MPETPDFDQIALRLSEQAGLPGRGAVTSEIAEQLRLVWNARGAADIAKLEIVLPTLTTVKPGAMKTVDAALRTLNR